MPITQNPAPRTGARRPALRTIRPVIPQPPRALKVAASLAAATAGSVAWAALLARLQLRALHMLQLEGYQSGRYLGWATQQRGRWVSDAGLATGLGSVGVASLNLVAGTGLPYRTLSLAVWGAFGAGLWRAARPGPATRPLVL